MAWSWLTFIIWGFFHGILLLINHLYRKFKYIKFKEKNNLLLSIFYFVLVSLGEFFLDLQTLRQLGV